MGDAAKIALEFAKAVADATPTLFQLFSHVGGRDKFLVVLDGVLVTVRAKTDADIAAKPRR
jgi:hypothetical protein